MSLCPQRGHHLYIHLWISCLSARARTHAHISIFKHAASAWRRDTTLEPKHIEGHSEIASEHTQGSGFLSLEPLHPSCTPPTPARCVPFSACTDGFYYCIVHLSMCWTGGPCTGRLEGIRASLLSHFVAMLSLFLLLLHRCEQNI